MRGRRRLLPVIVLTAAAGLLPGAGSSLAQELSTGEPATAAPEIVTIDQERLYAGSKFGQQILAGIDAQLKELQTENRKIENDLEAEEKELTQQRKTLSAEEFRKLADGFDEKVRQIRAARDAKQRDIGLQRDMAQKKFLNAAVPVLAQMMKELGASAIIDRKSVILSFDRIDITDMAIARIDAQLANQPDASPPQDQPPGNPDPANPVPDQPEGGEPPIMPDPAMPPAGAPSPGDGAATSP